MIVINFHKILQKITNVKSHAIEVTDFESLFLGLKATFPKLANYNNDYFSLLYNNKKSIVTSNMIQKKNIPENITEIWIVPIIQGNDGKVGTLALGAALIAISFYFPPAAAGTSIFSTAGLAAAAGNILLGVGINLVLSALFIQDMKKPDDKPGDEKARNNDAFGSLRNTISQDTPIALHYGDVRVSGQFISGTVKTINHGREDIINVGSFFE